MTARAGHRGFTLIEVLLALALLAMTFAALFSALYSTRRSVEAGERAAQSNESLRIAQTVVRNYLTGAVPLLFYDGKEHRLAFRGDPDAVRFVVGLPSHRGGGGLRAVRLGADWRGGRRALTFRYAARRAWDPANADSDASAEREALLLEDAGEIRFAYFGAQDGDAEPAWRSSWHSDERLPRLVRIEVRRASVPESRMALDIAIRARRAVRLPEMIVRVRPGGLPSGWGI